jgi:hypothetical protein
MGAGFAGTAAVASSIATTFLMIHFLRQLRLTASNDPGARAPTAIGAAWFAMVLASLALPWTLYLSIPLDTLWNAIAPAALWSALWPVLVGAGLAIVLNGIRARLPHVQAGDVGVALIPFGEEGGIAVGRLFEHVDAFARRWSVSCIALLLILLVFGWALRAVT